MLSPKPPSIDAPDEFEDVRLLSTAQAAALWGCSPETIRRLIKAGEPRTIPLGEARRRRIPIAELRAYISRRQPRRIGPADRRA